MTTPIQPKFSFKRLLGEVLMQREITPGQLATSLGVSRQTAYNWTSGRTLPNRGNRKKITELLGVPEERIWPELNSMELDSIVMAGLFVKKILCDACPVAGYPQVKKKQR